MVCCKIMIFNSLHFVLQGMRPGMRPGHPGMPAEGQAGHPGMPPGAQAGHPGMPPGGPAGHPGMAPGGQGATMRPRYPGAQGAAGRGTGRPVLMQVPRNV